MSQRSENSHKRIEALLIRHGESEFNFATEEFQTKFQEDPHSELGRRQFQLDPRLIDCPLTAVGRQQALKAKKQSSLEGVEVVFVSPLNRALETAQLIFGNKNVKFVVIPGLTEILSKICDISHSIQQKQKEFSHMDFSLFKDQENNWQMGLLTEQEKAKFNPGNCQPSAQEITNFLYQCISDNFPNSTEKRSDCTIRCQDNKFTISKLCYLLQASKVAVVAHRRTLIEMTKSCSHPDGIAMKNCEVKTLFLQ